MRPGDWQIGASIQQEVLPRVSVEVGYNRRWLQNFSVTDNLAVTPADFGTFSVVVPDDPRLPNAGQTISGLYNVNNNKFGVLDNYTTRAKNYGRQSQMYNGFLLNASARPTTALRLQFGLNLGNTSFDTCELRALLPEIDPLNPWCAYSTGLNTRVTGLAVYLVPKVDVSVSSTFRSDQGEQLAANRTFTSASLVPSLGRPLSGSVGQCDGEPGRAGHDVRRPAQRRRHAVRQGGALWPDAHERGVRYLQHFQCTTR